MSGKTYAVGDVVLVRVAGAGRFRAAVVSVGEAKPYWGPQYVLRGPNGEFHAYGNEFVEVGDYDFVF